MLPIRVDIQHFRALRDCALDLGDYTSLVGPNGVGKSTVLQALRFFLDPVTPVSKTDFQLNCEEPVSVTVTLSELTSEEISAYKPFLTDSGHLVVTKKSAGEATGYFVRAKKHLAFDSIRQSAGSKSEFLAAFRAFADSNVIYGLRKERSSELCEAELQRWEQEHPKDCVEGEIRFSFVGGAKNQLIPTTHLVYIPAVSEAAETLSGARSPVRQMIDALVYPRLEEKPEFAELKEHVERKYREIFPPDGGGDLREISSRLTKALSAFVPNTSVNLALAEDEPSLALPSVHPTLTEDGVTTEVERKGHGLQRAMIIAMLQAEDDYRRSLDERFSKATIHVLFMIEEPELYQHPPMARHLRRVLNDLATRKSGASRLRILLTTHSPDFVSLECIDTIRILRMQLKGRGVPKRRITSVGLDQIAERFAALSGKAINEQTLRRRLHSADPIMREALFANAVVLAEGMGDLGLICGECAVAQVDLEGKGIVVVSCDGKAKMALPICVMEMLGIRYYAVFDSDTAIQIEENRTLLRALNAEKKDIPDSGAPPTAVRKNYAVLNPKVEELIRNEFGKERYNECAERTASEFGGDAADVMKNPITAQYAIAAMREGGANSKTLDDIVSRISALA